MLFEAMIMTLGEEAKIFDDATIDGMMKCVQAVLDEEAFKTYPTFEEYLTATREAIQALLKEPVLFGHQDPCIL